MEHANNNIKSIHVKSRAKRFRMRSTQSHFGVPHELQLKNFYLVVDKNSFQFVHIIQSFWAILVFYTSMPKCLYEDLVCRKGPIPTWLCQCPRKEIHSDQKCLKASSKKKKKNLLKGSCPWSHENDIFCRYQISARDDRAYSMQIQLVSISFSVICVRRHQSMIFICNTFKLTGILFHGCMWNPKLTQSKKIISILRILHSLWPSKSIRQLLDENYSKYSRVKLVPHNSSLIQPLRRINDGLYLHESYTRDCRILVSLNHGNMIKGMLLK